MKALNTNRFRFLLLVLFCFAISCACSSHSSRRNRISKQKRFEQSKMMHDEMCIFHSGYTVSYNPRTLTANWVAYELTAEETDGPWLRKGLRFMPDPDCYEQQADNDDYQNSDYSRGHLAPAGDMKWDSVAMLESFYFTNCIPQDAALNNGKWNQLEMKTRAWAQQYGKIYVVCGPVFQSKDTLRIGHNGVAVPDACFKALLIPKEKGYSAIAFVMQNGGEERQLTECACTVDELEQILSIDLFCNLSKRQQNIVESVIVWEDWGFKTIFDNEN